MSFRHHDDQRADLVGLTFLGTGATGADSGTTTWWYLHSCGYKFRTVDRPIEESGRVFKCPACTPPPVVTPP